MIGGTEGVTIQFNIPSMVIQTIAAPVLDIPTPLSIIGGLFGGGKSHPGKYSFRYIWDGIKIGKDGIASVKPVVVTMIYRQRLWRAGEETTEKPVPFECFTYMIAKRLGDIINTKIPTEKRIPLKLAFQKLNPKFHVVTWAAHLEHLRQQGPANAAFDALKYAPAVLNTYGNCVRQMLGVEDMYDFLINHIGWDYLYPLSPVMRTKWHSHWFKRADWEDYGEWLLDNLKYRNPAGVRNWMSRTGIRTENLIKIQGNIVSTKAVSEAKIIKKTSAPTDEAYIKAKVAEFYRKYLGREPDPSGFNYWVNVAKSKGLEFVEKSIANSPEAKSKKISYGISDYLKNIKKLIPSGEVYAAPVEEFSKQQVPYTAATKKKEKSILDKINIDDILLLSAIAIPAVIILKGRH